MERDDIILISVDDHIIEPPDLFVDHLDAKYLDRAPKLVRNDEGTDVWTFRQYVMETSALNAVAGRPKEEYGLEPQSLDEVRPGCYDVHERVKDMDAGGVLASMNFPSFPTFTARVFATDDPDLSLALVRAYNDWHIDEWCGAYPGRFIPMAVPAIWDAAGVRRRGAPRRRQGLPLAELHREPGRARLPELPRRVLGPGVAGAAATPARSLSIHLGSSGRLVDPGGRLAAGRDDHAAADEHPVGGGRPAVVAGAQEVPGPADRAVGGRHRVDPVLPRPRRPHLRDALAPGRCRTSAAGCPREVFREHFLTCFISDPVGVELRDRHRRRQHVPGRPTTRTATRCGRPPPRSCARCSWPVRRARRRDQQDDARERDALVLLRPVPARPQGARPPSARCARPPPGTTCPSRAAATRSSPRPRRWPPTSRS